MTDNEPTAPMPKEESGQRPAAGLVLCAWFLLVAVSFWAPYLAPKLGIEVRPVVTSALYGVFLLIFLSAAGLSLLRRHEEALRGR